MASFCVFQYYETALHFAAQSGPHDLVSELLDKGAYANSFNKVCERAWAGTGVGGAGGRGKRFVFALNPTSHTLQPQPYTLHIKPDIPNPNI